MHFTTLVPSVFYPDIKDGLRLFVDCLQFKISHKELHSTQPFCVLKKEGLRIKLFQNAALAQEHHPEFRLVTLNIEEVYNKVSASHPQYLHPNLKTVTLRPWGQKNLR